MMKTKLLSFIVVAGILLPACNIPETSSNQSVSTAAALTMQAALTSPVSTPSAVSIVTKPSSAILTLTDNTNCRAGQGTSFERLTVIPEGTSVLILARSSDGKYWLVKPPEAADFCWVLGELGTVSGDTAGVPQATSAAGENSAAPAKPGNLFYQYECTFGSPQPVTTTLTWSDVANNENGYRVSRNGVLIIELPANSTQYVDHTSLAIGGGLSYCVEAFNDAGSSSRCTQNFSC
jgi:hypothetical protein